ncbi:UDP-galactopyranose mutase [Candidatus Saccharibacteria bacterium]|nr:UDP-galactopyranose mutase [Candidatus Saccharibacteria bacterium]
MKDKYDYGIIGAGVFGATVAERLASAGKKVLVIDRRKHLAGNIYSYIDEGTGIEVHKYGSHIFHTEMDEVWDYITEFAEFNDYVHTVDTRHEGKLYPMPINLDTINLLYDTNMNAEEAEAFVKEEAAKDVERLGIKEPQNFEEKGISLVGEKLYTAFLKNYTEKQWNTSARNLSAEILKRIPVRFSHDNRYFMTAKHQGIPKNGYTKMIENMLNNENIEVRLDTDYKDVKDDFDNTKIVYCGQVDELLDYELGVLPWRSLRFEEEKTTETLGEAVINEADKNVPYTRAHDYKYYQIHQPEVVEQDISIIAKEYPVDFEKGEEAYYPVNNPESMALYEKYVRLCKEKYPNLILGGRLGAYQYWDMDKAIKNALDLVIKLKKGVE